MKSILAHAQAIFDGIIKTVQFVAPIVGVIDPPLAPIMMEAAQVIALLESKGQTITPDQSSQIVQAVVAAHIAKLASNPPAV